MLAGLHARLSDRIADRRGVILFVAAALTLGSMPVLATRAQLDTSFRPLFARDAAATAATLELEERFGQTSGAHLGVIVQHNDPVGSVFFRQIAELRGQLSDLAGISEVVAPVRSPDPLVSADARAVLLLARIDAPLEDLRARRRVIRDVEVAVAAWRPEQVTTQLTGVSVVEAAYADAVPRGMASSLALTTAAVIITLYLLFGTLATTLVCLTGVAVATPLTLALLALSGRPLTLLSSMAPTVILIIGVADAVHMVRRWDAEAVQRTRRDAIRHMMTALALPCLLTTLTTVLGFAALGVARVHAIRDFGISTALGVLLVYVANMVLVPALLHQFAPRISRKITLASRWDNVLEFGARRPALTMLGAAAITIAIAFAAPRLRVDQRFNEELPASHPVRAAQSFTEREFGGFLGPSLHIERRDGRSALDESTLTRLTALRDALAALPQVDRVGSVLDVLPAGAVNGAAGHVAAARAQMQLWPIARETMDGSHLAVHVYTGDIGTRAARALADTIDALARTHMGDGYAADIAGQWWLAQLGMSALLRDMLASFFTAALLVLPVLAVALRAPRMLLIALPANVLPMIGALAFMAVTGITLRIGTALVLAVSLAVAVDDTIHLLARVAEERQRTSDAVSAMRRGLRACAPALLATTAVLVVGFLSMLTSQLAAVREMGLVAAVTLVLALAADIWLTPALYVLLPPPHTPLRHATAATTSLDGLGASLQGGSLHAGT